MNKLPSEFFPMKVSNSYCPFLVQFKPDEQFRVLVKSMTFDGGVDIFFSFFSLSLEQ